MSYPGVERRRIKKGKYSKSVPSNHVDGLGTDGQGSRQPAKATPTNSDTPERCSFPPSSPEINLAHGSLSRDIRRDEPWEEHCRFDVTVTISVWTSRRHSWPLAYSKVKARRALLELLLPPPLGLRMTKYQMSTMMMMTAMMATSSMLAWIGLELRVVLDWTKKKTHQQFRGRSTSSYESCGRC